MRKTSGDQPIALVITAAMYGSVSAGARTGHQVPTVEISFSSTGDDSPASKRGTAAPGEAPQDLVHVAVLRVECTCWPPFLLSVKSASGVIAGEGHLRRCGTGRATTP